MSELVGTAEDPFSHNESHMMLHVLVTRNAFKLACSATETRILNEENRGSILPRQSTIKVLIRSSLLLFAYSQKQVFSEEAQIG